MTRTRWWITAVVALTVAGLAAGPAASQEPPRPDVRTAALAAVEGVRAAADEHPVPDASATEAGAGVASPATFLDPVNNPADASPYHPRGDLTVFQVRNGRNVFDFRFFLRRRPLTWPSGETGAVLRVDVAANGIGTDYEIVVVAVPGEGKVAVVGPTGFDDASEIRCIARDVRDIGSTFVGYGYSARIPFRCIGGKRGVRTRLGFVYAWYRNDPLPTFDVVPNNRWTPVVRPA